MSHRLVSPSFASRHQAWIVAIPTALTSLLLARWLSAGSASLPLGLIALLGIIGLGVMFALGPRIVFLGWLLAAPFLQNSADASSVGYTAGWALYLVPGAVLAVMTVLDWQHRPMRWYDPVPLAYGVYAATLLVLTSNLLGTDTTGTAKAFFLIVALGIIVFYFLAFGPGVTISAQSIAAVLMLGAIVQSALTYVEVATRWNLWHDVSWQRDVLPRPVSTLANPAILGMFIGVGVVIALAVLAWQGPPSLRRLSWVTLLAGAPAIILTLTRGPILATTVASVGVLLASRRTWILGLSVLALGAIVLVALWPSIHRSELYRDRVSNTPNVQARVLLQDWSLRLAEEKPFFGWGYGSFDQVKNESDFGTGGLPASYVLNATSHNTYLTVLVEYGGVGLLLLVTPWLAISLAALRRSSAMQETRWLVVGTVAGMLVIGITASTADFRFFSLAQVLPGVLVGTLRRTFP